MTKLLSLLLLFGCATSNQISLKKHGLLKGHTRRQHEAFAGQVMVASQGVASTEAGLKMIKLGGNAFDAAAAISFAISVERPQSTGIGGGGFMLLDGPEIKEPIALDFREKAPLKAHSKMYLSELGEPIPELPLDGILASGVPGTVKGVLEMQAKFGVLTRAEILKPAIELAEKGFKVYPHLAMSIKRRAEVLKRFPASQKIFFKDGRPLKVGDHLVQKDLALTLKAIQRYGVKGFYEGWVADSIVKEFKRRGGLITHKDLKKYNTRWRKPVTGTYKGYDIYSMSPPSSGGTHVVQILNIVEPMNLKQYGAGSAEAIHRTATAMQMAFVDRARYMGDADFVKIPVSKISRELASVLDNQTKARFIDLPIKGLTSKKYASLLRAEVGDRALKLSTEDLKNPFGYESDETTHFTVMDREGNVVSSTQTINYLLGSGVVIPGTGIVMNDEMDDFSKKADDTNVFGAVGSTHNLVQPEKRPLSSMSPTLIKKDGKPVLALGTPSGTRILTCVAQVTLNYLEHEMDLWDAVASTRYHHQWRPDSIRIEEPGVSSSVREELVSKGHKLEDKMLGCKVQAIAFKNQRLHGVSDPRGEGLAKGL